MISVGSADNAIFPAQNATVSTGYGPITYFDWMAFTSGTYPLYAFSTDPAVTFDGCTIPDGTPDLTANLVIVRRGGCTLATKAQTLYSKGASMMFLVNYAGSVPLYYTPDFPMQFAMINNDDGNYLLNQIASGSKPTVTFSFSPTTIPNTYTGNTTTFFSSIGPTNDLHMSPSVLAPGTNIVSVIPTAQGNWTMGDGTSQASAFAAGAAALYVNAKGTANVSPKNVKEALQFSANQLVVSTSDSTLESVAAQGAGKIQLFDAINTGTVVSPTELLLNDTAYSQSLQYLTLQNTGSSHVTYKLSNVPAGTALAFQSGLNQSNDEPVPQVANAASVVFSQSSLSLRPGQSTIVILKFTAPTGLDPATFPIYSGWIQITGGSNTVQVPYLGVAAKMKNLPVLDPTTYYIPFNTPTIIDSNFNVQSGTTPYNFQNGNYPTILYRLVQSTLYHVFKLISLRLVGGTQLLLVDLVSANATLGFTPNYTSRKRSIEGRVEEIQTLPKRADLESRRIQGTSQASPSGLGGLLNLWCQLTHYTGNGCTTTGSNTFNNVPILGNLYEADYIPRK